MRLPTAPISGSATRFERSAIKIILRTYAETWERGKAIGGAFRALTLGFRVAQHDGER